MKKGGTPCATRRLSPPSGEGEGCRGRQTVTLRCETGEELRMRRVAFLCSGEGGLPRPRRCGGRRRAPDRISRRARRARSPRLPPRARQGAVSLRRGAARRRRQRGRAAASSIGQPELPRLRRHRCSLQRDGAPETKEKREVKKQDEEGGEERKRKKKEEVEQQRSPITAQDTKIIRRVGK